MSSEALLWAAIGGLYAWQIWHSRSCMHWRSEVSRALGKLEGKK